MSDSYVKFKFKDVEYEITTRDVTNQRLRQMKQWFGPAYGSFNGFPRLLIELDADAWACALWIAQQLTGEKIEDPRMMDFSMDDLELLIEEPEVDAEGEPDPTQDVDTSRQISDSSATA